MEAKSYFCCVFLLHHASFMNIVRTLSRSLCFSALLLSSVCSFAQDDHFYLGADISGTTALEARGDKLYNAKGELRENTALMHELGLDAIRLRVWVNPEGGFCSPADVLDMAKRAKYYGMALMIDFHYSDWWADPGHSPMPALWQYYSLGEVEHALALHTEQTLYLLKDNNIDVRWVQVGNETTHGFVWPMAKAEDDMDAYARLTKAGYEAVKRVFPQAQVIIHLDAACDPVRYDFIFDALRRRGVRWDLIGLSLYPYWDQRAGLTASDQESIDKAVANMRRLADKYGSDVMVVETGILVERAKEQKKLMADIIEAARDRTGGHCHGVFYWAPELEDGSYKLGAFKNGRPTEIMEAFTEAARSK